jgi:hypothetical protein
MGCVPVWVCLDGNSNVRLLMCVIIYSWSWSFVPSCGMISIGYEGIILL